MLILLFIMNLKMTVGRSKRRSFLMLTFLVKFSNYADRLETFSSGLVDFRETRFYESRLQSEVELKKHQIQISC